MTNEELIAKQQIRIKQLEGTCKAASKIIHDMVVGNQAAWIEWQHGKGAKAAMNWVHNGLAGPGHIPCEEISKYHKDAQLFYNEQKADPFPICPCGNPSRIMWMGNGYCCEEHQEMHKDFLEDKAESATKTVIDQITKA